MTYKKGKPNGKKPGMRGKQGRKDSRDPRINFDNARESKIERDIDEGKFGGPAVRGTNHDSDYNKQPQLVESAGRLGFSSVPGLGTGYAGAVPGVLTLTITPSFGGKNIHVLQQLKEAYYSWVAHGNSRNRIYNANDLMLLTLGVQECYQIVSEMKRAYGLMQQYDAQNAYKPKAILRSLGFHFGDLEQNYAHMESDINLLISEMKQFWIPNTMPVLDRTLRLAEYIYMDSESPKGQFYALRRGCHYYYDETKAPSGGILAQCVGLIVPGAVEGDEWYNLHYVNFMPQVGTTMTEWNAAGRLTFTWKEWMATAHFMIDKLVYSEDRGIICGDILKAYDASKIFAMPLMPNNYVTPIVYDQEVLMQIANSVSVSSCYMQELVQDLSDSETAAPSTLRPRYFGAVKTPYVDYFSKPKLFNGRFKLPGRLFLNVTWAGQPTPMEIFKATRLAVCKESITPTTYTEVTTGSGGAISYNTKTEYRITPDSTGSEVVNYYTVNTIYPHRGGDEYTLRVQVTNFLPCYTAAETADKNSYYALADWMAFDWAPTLYTLYEESNIPNIDSDIMPVCDWNNYAIADAANLQVINQVALYSLYDVPIV